MSESFGAIGEFALGQGPSQSTTTVYGFNYTLGTPPNPRKGVHPSRQTDFAWPLYQPVVPPTTDIRWFSPLSQPVLVARRLPPALVPAFFPDPFPEPARPPTDPRWMQPLAEPVRTRPRLHAANNPAFVRSTAPFRQPSARTYVIT